MMERLTQRRDYNCACWNGVQDYTTHKRYLELLDRLAQYEDAEEEGRLVVLPCKIGDTIYDIYEFIENRDSPEIFEYSAETIEIGQDKRGVYFIIDSTIFRLDDFGKSAFLSKEEAEKALKGESE
jgi:hypothetical protein